MVFERHFDSHLGAVRGHLFERFDAIGQINGQLIVLGIVGSGNRGRRDARAAAIHTHRLGAQDGGAVEPFLGDIHAGFPFLDVELTNVAGGVVGDVLALGSGGSHFGGEFFQPLAPRSAGGVEFARRTGSHAHVQRHLNIHAVIGDIAEETGKQVHVSDTGKGVLGELREVQHGDLAILRLHIPAHFVVPAICPGLEDVADGPGVGSQAVQFLFFSKRGSDGLRDHCNGAGSLQKVSAVNGKRHTRLY